MNLHSYRKDDVQVLSISGSFDSFTAPAVKEWLENQITSTPVFIVVNLATVDFLDSTALSILLQAMRKAKSRNGDLHLCNLRQPVRMIFELTRLDKVFEIYLNEEEAARAFFAVEGQENID